jgi:DNA (cytosine-5)-methyltransferase 1
METAEQMVRIKTAASMLGVSDQTVRNWVKAGQLPATRHPVNGYRLFRLRDIERLANQCSGLADDRGQANQLVPQLDRLSDRVSYRASGQKIVRQLLTATGHIVETKLPRLSSSAVASESEYERAWLRQPEPPTPAPLGRRIRIGDAFSGGGIFSLGVDEGLRALGMVPTHAFGVDFDQDAIATFTTNFPSSAAIHADVTTLADGKLGAPETEAEKRFLERAGGGVDILIAGPPCQGHSDLNNHTRRQDPKNDLYFSVARLAELLQPAFLIVENVPGVVHDRSGVVARTTAALRTMGYHISSQLVDLRMIGVPQSRKRFVVVASKTAPVDIAAAVSLHAGPHRTVSWAIEDLAAAYDEADVFNSSASHSAENRRRIDYLFDNDLHELPNSERPACHRDKTHSYVSVYGRMWWDRPSPTITGGFGSTGQGRFVHPIFRRTLTPHEACRLQFVPDFFRFPNDIGRRSMQQIIGNAAPPKLSQAIVLGAALQGALL